MIYVVGKNIPASELYTPTSADQFLDWLREQPAYQFDLETNITRTVFGRKIRTMQFGEVRTSAFEVPGIRFFIHWHGLSEHDKERIRVALRRRDQKKYIHNAIFEYETMLNEGVVLENVFDTMLAEQVKWTGYFTGEEDEEGNSFFSLAGCMKRYFDILLDKSYQTAFVDEFELTEGHVIYAVDDVTHLDLLADRQLAFLKQEGLLNVLSLENEVVLAFGDITWNGMLLDRDKWIANLELAEPEIQKANDILNQWLKKEPKFEKFAKTNGYIYTEDTVEFNKNSPVHKENLIKRIFPNIQGASLPIVKKFRKDYSFWDNPEQEALSIPMLQILDDILNKDWSSAFLYLVREDRQWLVDENYLIPAGTIKLNWNSRDQILPMFQTADKSLKDLSEKSRNTFEHPIVPDFENYKKGLKLTSSYGMKFLELMDFDGRVRTRFNQVLSTGRVSSSQPNIQQIPHFDDDPDPKRQYRYHNAFVAEEGWSFAGCDYTSQELVIIAHISQDPVWQAALKNKEDLHSVCAALLHGIKWKQAEEPGCQFAINRKKCKCKGHKTMRNGTKTLDFGLAYGMSVFKLAGSLHISVPEAQELMDSFFATFPGIGKSLTNLGGYGVQTGLIKTLHPFYRKRWFPKWNLVKDRVEEHIMGIRYNGILGEIERASKNMPIQGTAADMCKLALVYIRRYINDNNLRHKVRLSMQVHDEILCEVRNDYATEWCIILQKLMEQAAKVIIPSGLLKAEASISTVWTK